MAKPSSYGLGLACFAVAVAVAGATQFTVGGANGWSVPAAGAESFNTWAERTRFQIGDTLVFVYPKDQDSVLLVEPADYNACNTSSYVRRFDDGDTVFTLDRSGALFFISGVETNCRANEKLIVMVLAAGRNGTGGAPAPRTAPPPSSSPSPPPATSTLPSPPSSPPPASSTPPPSSSPAPKSPTASPPSPSSAAPPPATTPASTPPPASSPPPPSSSPAAPMSTPPPAPTGAPKPAHANSTGAAPRPAGHDDRNSAALTVAAGLASSLGACIVGYAMLAL